MGLIARVRASAPREKNVGGLERLTRLTAGAVLLVVAAALLVGYGPTTAGDPLVRAGLALVALLAGTRLLWTGYTQKCRLNRRIGRDSYRQ